MLFQRDEEEDGKGLPMVVENRPPKLRIIITVLALTAIVLAYVGFAGGPTDLPEPLFITTAGLRSSTFSPNLAVPMRVNSAARPTSIASGHNVRLASRLHAASTDETPETPPNSEEEREYEIEPRYEADTVIDFKRRRYYFGRVKIDMGQTTKPLTEEFAPTRKAVQTAIASVRIALPMGMVLAESEEEAEEMRGMVVVEEVFEGSNAEKAGIKKGDIVRAVTAKVVDVKKRGEDNLAFTFAADIPEKSDACFFADKAGFNALMDAILTNRAESSGDNTCVMVLERSYDDEKWEAMSS